MKLAISLALFLCVFAAASAEAQIRTVTNADLEQYKQKRLQGERELREDYGKLGFPSPEEMARQMEKSKQERLDLSARLRAERLEGERLAVERERAIIDAENLALQRQQAAEAAASPNVTVIERGYYGYPNSIFFPRRFRGLRGWGVFGPGVRVGNGIPSVDYYGTPGFGGGIFR